MLTPNACVLFLNLVQTSTLLLPNYSVYHFLVVLNYSACCLLCSTTQLLSLSAHVCDTKLFSLSPSLANYSVCHLSFST